MATDADGKILITGDFDRTIAFPGGPTLVVAERYDGFHGEDVFVAALSPAGEHLWSRRFGDEDRQFGMAIAAKSDGEACPGQPLIRGANAYWPELSPSSSVS